MEPYSIILAALNTKCEHFEVVDLPFGLKNLAATFMKHMNKLCGNELNKFVNAYLDDTSVYSKASEDHLGYLKSVLK